MEKGKWQEDGRRMTEKSGYPIFRVGRKIGKRRIGGRKAGGERAKRGRFQISN